MNQKIACALPTVVLMAAGWSLARAADPISWRETKTAAGTRRVTIESDLYRLTFDPARGGRCTSFLFKKTQRQWVHGGPRAGLFQDHFAHQGYPGELLHAPYTYAVRGDRARHVCLHLWTIAKGVVRGSKRRDRLTAGLKVEKRITLRAGRREIRVVNTFRNPTAEGRNVALWVQHKFAYGGQQLFDSYYRPSASGLSLDGMDDKGDRRIAQGFDPGAADWVHDPVAGWTAGRDRRTSEGAVFLMDYNYLDKLYNCAPGYTTEWFLDKVPLPAGKSWSTEHLIVPVDGFRGFAHASRRLIANVEVRPGKDRVRITYQLAGTTDPLGSVVLNTRIYGVRTKREEALSQLTVSRIGLDPVEAAQSWGRAQTEPLVVRVNVSGPDWQEGFEYVYEGAFRAEGIVGAAARPEYTVPRPGKVKTFLKPDRWTRPENKHPRVLLVYGLWTQHYRIEQAVRKLDPAGEIKVCDGWDSFPPTYDELLGFDVVVLSNMPAGPDYANEMVADFVRHGGGLLVLGGMRTFGGGAWQGTALATLLPVTVPPSFGLKWDPQGVAVTAIADHPATNGITWADAARFYWVHDSKPNPGATVALRAGKRALLVLGTCGEGRVAAFLGSCQGEPRAGQVPGWTTRAWTQLITQMLRWLKEGK